MAKASVFNGDDLTLVKDYGDGMKAFSNKTGSAVGIFADMDEGEYFMVSGWVKHQSKSLQDIADSLYY
ncbi:MAG: hypothetical protein HRU12_19360 [Phaeodactylibacter sp.]|nr:hypothetical protein [Phaeodactylibacter sp.]